MTKMANQPREEGAPWMSLFAGEMAPYKPPSSPIARFFWSWRLWFEATFVFTMLEPWEKGLLMALIGSFFAVFVLGIYRYLPHHLFFLYQRAAYYLLGQEHAEWPSVSRAGAAAFASLKSGVGM